MLSVTHHLVLLSGIVLIFTGCGRDAPPAEERAAKVFSKAKQALARNDYLESKRLLRESVPLFEELGDNPRLAETLLLLGQTYSSAARFDSAGVLFGRAVYLYRRLSDKPGIRAAVFALADMHRARSEDLKAFAVLADELRVEEALGDTYGIRQLKLKLVPVCRSVGDVRMEQRLMTELLQDVTAAGDEAGLAAAHQASGDSFLSDMRYEQAIESFTVALSSARQARDTTATIRICQLLGMTYDRMGRQADAFRMYTEGLRTSDMVHGAEHLREEMLLLVGNSYLRSRQYDQARRFLNASLSSAIRSQNSLLEAYALLQLGHALNGLGDSEAGTNYRSGADLLAQLGISHGKAYASLCLGLYAAKKGQFPDALEHLRNAVASDESSFVRRNDDVIQDCENTVPYPQPASPCDALIDLLLQVGRQDEAFAVEERRKQSAFLHTFTGFDIQTRDDTLNAALNRYSNLRADYTGAQQQLINTAEQAASLPLAADITDALTTAARRLKDLGDSLASEHPLLRGALDPSATALTTVKEIVPRGTTLVVYIPTGEAMYIYLVSGGRIGVHIAPAGREELRRLMKDYAHLIQPADGEEKPSAPDLRQLQTVSSRLYGFFIRPVELNAGDSEHLLVVWPSGLPFIPLHALRREGLATPYAIERYAIRYLPDVASLLLTGSAMGKFPAVVGFGNQGRSETDVEYEVRDAKAFFKDASLFFGQDATLRCLRGVRGDILHAAFELEYRPARPGNSFFVLSGGTGYSTVRYYRFGQLFGIAPFATVILSNLSHAELHPCLPRIFLMDGVSDLVMNSYVPTRQAKNFFNQEFYGGLLAGASAGDAYRRALLAMIRNPASASPRTWAAFSLW